MKRKIYSRANWLCGIPRSVSSEIEPVVTDGNRSSACAEPELKPEQKRVPRKWFVEKMSSRIKVITVANWSRPRECARQSSRFSLVAHSLHSESGAEWRVDKTYQRNEFLFTFLLEVSRDCSSRKMRERASDSLMQIQRTRFRISPFRGECIEWKTLPSYHATIALCFLLAFSLCNKFQWTARCQLIAMMSSRECIWTDDVNASNTFLLGLCTSIR